jgi:phage gpG-like protein
MSDAITIEVAGLEEVQKKMTQMVKDVRGGETMRAMKLSTLLVQRAAKKNLTTWRGPGTGGVDTGRMRASIVPEIRTLTGNIVGVVGSSVSYAPYKELGTRPHWVSARHIGRWAERHGLGYRAVFVSGKALKFLQRAYDNSLKKIQAFFDKAIQKAVNK